MESKGLTKPYIPAELRVFASGALFERMERRLRRCYCL